MDKRYQIFISSTYSDLKDERDQVMRAILQLKCFPAGMELFPAIDKQQFKYIQSVIDECDYYILIIGARYGSMDKNGVSYTEKEYNYAVRKKIPILAFLHRDIKSIPLGNADTDIELIKKLEIFRKKVQKGRLVNYWSNPDDLKAKVLSSIPSAIKQQPGTGWVRADEITNEALQKAIEGIKKDIGKVNTIKKESDLIDWDKEFTITFEKKESPFEGYNDSKELTFPIAKTNTWRNWFMMIARKIDELDYFESLSYPSMYYLIPCLYSLPIDCSVKTEDLSSMRYKFIADGVITENSGNYSIWELTSKGKLLLAQMMTENIL